MRHHGDLQRFAQAAADNDALAEEFGVANAVEQLGLVVDDLAYVAEQRALRAVMIASEREDELKAAQARGSNRPLAFALDGVERRKLMAWTALYMDGIAIGIRFERARTGP